MNGRNKDERSLTFFVRAQDVQVAARLLCPAAYSEESPEPYVKGGIVSHSFLMYFKVPITISFFVQRGPFLVLTNCYFWICSGVG